MDQEPQPRHEALLRIDELTVRFGGRPALDRASLSIDRGEVHALVGQNGSGKSTLIKVLAGINHPFAGNVTVEGEPLPMPPSSHDLIRQRVSFVHQDLGLVDELSVTDNICISDLQYSKFLRLIDSKKQDEIARSVLARLGTEIDERARVETLSPAERTMVAMARGLLVQGNHPGLLVLDEVTRALTESSAKPVYAAIRAAVSAGGGVLMISHNLEEVLAVADRLTVLRDGRVVVKNEPVGGLTEREIARLMLGHDVSTEVTRAAESAGRGAPVATVSRLHGGNARGLDLTVARGEVVGLTGIEGSGYEDVPYLLSAASKVESGTLRLPSGEIDLARANVAACLRAGIAVVPEERHRDGLALSESIEENISLPRIGSKGSWWLSRGWQYADAVEVINILGVTPPDPDAITGTLSGGNQQKVMVGKWMLNQPDLLVLHEPTQAVDVNARMDILSTVRRLADSGIGVLLVTREATDLVAICDRILVVREGTVAEELVTERPDDVIESVYRAHQQSTESSTRNGV